MNANQNDDEIKAKHLFAYVGQPISNSERDETIALILEHLKLEVWRIDTPEDGMIALQLRDVDA